MGDRLQTYHVFLMVKLVRRSSSCWWYKFSRSTEGPKLNIVHVDDIYDVAVLLMVAATSDLVATFHI